MGWFTPAGDQQERQLHLNAMLRVVEVVVIAFGNMRVATSKEADKVLSA
jgi:hypothetical protein